MAKNSQKNYYQFTIGYPHLIAAGVSAINSHNFA